MAKMYVMLPDKKGTIAPEIYGHFTEHIGGVIYDGIWVGKNSKIPNYDGFRKEIVDKLRSNVINTIPLWRNQMVLALGIEHSRRALDAQSAITEMTNEMFRINAETLRQGAIDAATAAERAVVDVETLKVVNQEIIKSINEVVRIHEEGTKRRMDAQNELAKIEDELKTALLEAGSR